MGNAIGALTNRVIFFWEKAKGKTLLSFACGLCFISYDDHGSVNIYDETVFLREAER